MNEFHRTVKGGLLTILLAAGALIGWGITILLFSLITASAYSGLHHVFGSKDLGGSFSFAVVMFVGLIFYGCDSYPVFIEVVGAERDYPVVLRSVWAAFCIGLIVGVPLFILFLFIARPLAALMPLLSALLFHLCARQFLEAGNSEKVLRGVSSADYHDLIDR